MTNEEREIITRFIERIGGAPASGGGFASVPATRPQLPPIDAEADALIGQLFSRYPEARYRLTQTAYVQDLALIEAQNRIKRLEWELQQAQQAAQAAQRGSAGASGGGFFSNLFGGGSARPGPAPNAWGQPGQQQYAPPPPPQYPPGYAPPQQMMQRGGSGFLGSALTTAAGVAGGMIAGNALMNMFSGGHGAAAAAGLGAGGADSPWGAPPDAPAGGDPGFVDNSNWSTDQNYAQSDQGDWGGGDQSASWSDPGGDAGWSDNNDDFA